MTTDGVHHRARHVISALHAHLVFVRKHRRGALTGEMIWFLVSAFGKVCQGFGAALAECPGENDHVHLLVEYPPKCQPQR